MPLLLSAPGRVAADTKLFLYLDPWRLLGDAVYTWDARQFGGWVPHQNVGYLWPSGPWYAVFDLLSVPDWITQRLWLGTILVLAGLGTLWMGRILGMPRAVAITAAFTYQMSPYVLPYISRTSALLLPWAMLPFLIGLTVRMSRALRWRDALLFAGAIATAGGLNATALLMVLPGPAIWLLVEFVRHRAGRRSVVTAALVQTAVTVGASAWWMAGLSTQGAYGAPVLSYSEALPSTSATSTSTEVLRGLGYWIFYDRPPGAPLTTAAEPYQTNLIVIVVGVVLAVAGLTGVLLAARHRRALVTMVLAGTVLAVGAHPFDDPSPLWSPFADRPTSAVSLALRSSSRAVPLVALALAVGVGWTFSRARQRLTPTGSNQGTALARPARTNLVALIRTNLVAATLAILLVVNLPALVGGRLIDPNVSRPDDIPSAWTEAARLLDSRYDDGMTGAVLIVPGIDSQAFEWGYTVDPILPGLTKKTLLTRDWLPLGSAPHMDLLYALDDAFQSGTATPEIVAPVARLLGADTVMVVNSFEHERFDTATPEQATALINSTTPGLEHLADFGPSSADTSPTGPPEIQLYEVRSPFVAGTTAHPTVVSGDGTSLVDLAAAGLLDEPGIRLMSASLVGDDLVAAIDEAAEVIVTDGNRIRAHHWRGSQEVWGATEPLTGVVDVDDVFDSRLPVFPLTTDDPATRSYVATSAVTATATSYGALLTYRPEYRPAMAIDGDIDTAWTVGWGIEPVGQTLTITSESAVDRLELSPFAFGDRVITAVDVRVDEGEWFRVPDPSGPVELATSGTVVRIRIADVSGPADDPVGFAEVLPIERTSAEIVRVPVDATDVAGSDTPVSFVFTRLRADETEPGRLDPETAIRRSFAVPHDDSFDLSGTVRGRLPETGTCISGLLEIDGSEVTVTVDGNGKLAWCDDRPLSLAAGDHTLIARSSSDGVGIDVDQIVLRSTSTPIHESTSTTFDVTTTRTTRTAELPICASDTCWVQMSEGWNVGWRGEIDGRRLDDPIAAASGRNVWRIAASETGTLTATWTPQSRMWWGLSITGLTFVTLLALTIREVVRRRRAAIDSAGFAVEATNATRGRSGIKLRLAQAVGAAALMALIITPWWGLGALVIVPFLSPRRLERLGLSFVTLALMFVVAQQVRTQAAAGFGWPSVFERAHRPALFGLALLVVAVWAPEHPASDSDQ